MEQVATETQNNNSDRALRPITFESFLGQEESKYNLQVYVATAKGRGEPLDHTLMAGPPGLGKTTLAHILANEMGSRLVVISAPSIRTKGDLCGLLINLKEGDLLFLDEIHSLDPKIEEILYSAMEDRRLEVSAGNQAVSVDLPAFTLLGATTRAGMLSRPLRDRFGEIVQMVPYTVDELSKIILRNATKLGLTCSENAAVELSKRSRGTPRIANRLLRRVRDFAQFEGLDHISSELVKSVCDRLGIDELGIDRTSRKMLEILTDKNGPVGLSTLASLTGESKDTIEEAIEPHLMRIGMIERTPKGRQATPAAYRHLYPEN